MPLDAKLTDSSVPVLVDGQVAIGKPPGLRLGDEGNAKVFFAVPTYSVCIMVCMHD